jgi:ribose-phosphate pyrophosphokinase
MSDELKIFSGSANVPLYEKICDYLSIAPGQITVERFPDGECFCRIEEDVRGRDVFIIQPTCRPVNDNLMELLIMIECFKRASAGRITAVFPYFGYARQDRKDISSLGYSPEESVVVSPDEGSIKRAAKHVKTLGGTLAIIDKRRCGNRIEQANLIGGPIEGRVAFLFDDMIATGGSICGAARLVKKMGATKIYLAATHAVLCGNAIEQLREAPIEEVVVSDTIPLLPEHNLPNIRALTIAPILAEAIKRIHNNESISRMFKQLSYGNIGQYY